MAKVFRVFRRFVWFIVKLSFVVLFMLLVWVWFANPYQEQTIAQCASRPPIGLAALEAKAPGYQRAESPTYLAFPERYVVFNGVEYARTLMGGRPSRFPYFRSAAQFWRGYYRVFKITQAKYGFDARSHAAPVAIGLGFTIENVLKGVYENTVGRLTERYSDGGKSEEDDYAMRLAAEYGQALHATPFYAFPYTRALTDLWRLPFRGANQTRKIERRLMLTVEYGSKAVYGLFVRMLRRATNEDEPLRTHALALVNRSPDLVAIPRYAAFTQELPALLRKGVTIYEIAGNDEIFLTVLAPAGWSGARDGGAKDWRVELVEPLLTDPAVIRVGLTVPVSCLGRALPELQSTGATLEHLYDY
jgi:hypothetical protein